MNRKHAILAAVATVMGIAPPVAGRNRRCERGYSRAEIRRALERKLRGTGIVMEFNGPDTEAIEAVCNPLTIAEPECQSTQTWSVDGFIDAVMRRLDE